MYIDKINIKKNLINAKNSDYLLNIIDEFDGIWQYSDTKLNIIGLRPVLKIYENYIVLNNQKIPINNPLKFMDKIINNLNINNQIGFMGYISYDYNNLIQTKNQDIITLPKIYFALFSDYIVFNSSDKKFTHYKLSITANNKTIKLEQIDFESISFPIIEKTDKKTVLTKDHMPQKLFIENVKKSINQIKLGNVYQLNLTRALEAKTEKSLLEISKNLLESNFIEHGFIIKVNNRYIISTSPERFFLKKDDTITTSPIKGTIDSNQPIKKLTNSTKEMAELSMIVDLLRNDISVICEYGTVVVDKFPKFTKLNNVIHMYGDIKGKLKDNVNLYEIIDAMFPGGSISGCPKISACKIINQLEPINRGIYTGTAGIYSFNKEMDFNILIRTVIFYNKNIIFNVGGGITILSNPEEEFTETVIKAKNITNALNMEDIIN